MPLSGQNVLPSVVVDSDILDENVVDAVNGESGVNSGPFVFENVSGDVAANVENVVGVSDDVLLPISEHVVQPSNDVQAESTPTRGSRAFTDQFPTGFPRRAPQVAPSSSKGKKKRVRVVEEEWEDEEIDATLDSKAVLLAEFARSKKKKVASKKKKSAAESVSRVPPSVPT